MSGPNSDSGDSDDGAPDEPRVRDLLQRRAAADAIDPDTAAKLAAWFDLPSFQQVTEAEAEQAAAPPAELSKIERAAQRRKDAIANVDPDLLGYLGRHEIAANTIHRLRPTPSRWEGRMLAFDERQVPAIPDADDLPEVVIPQALRKDLKICAPQASLRDLHRPEKEFFIELRPAFEPDDEPVSPDPMEPVRAVLRSSYRVGVNVDTAKIAGTAAWISIQRVLAQPWAESKRERARQREAELLAKLDASAPGKDRPPGPVPRDPEEAS